jgi:hypothetical protein
MQFHFIWPFEILWRQNFRFYEFFLPNSFIAFHSIFYHLKSKSFPAKYWLKTRLIILRSRVQILPLALGDKKVALFYIFAAKLKLIDIV